MGIIRNVKKVKYKDAVRTSLAYMLSDLFEENYPMVAEIQAADVQKNDAFLINTARIVITDIERKIKVLEDKA